MCWPGSPQAGGKWLKSSDGFFSFLPPSFLFLFIIIQSHNNCIYSFASFIYHFIQPSFIHPSPLLLVGTEEGAGPPCQLLWSWLSSNTGQQSLAFSQPREQPREWLESYPSGRGGGLLLLLGVLAPSEFTAGARVRGGPEVSEAGEG